MMMMTGDMRMITNKIWITTTTWMKIKRMTMILICKKVLLDNISR